MSSPVINTKEIETLLSNVDALLLRNKEVIKNSVVDENNLPGFSSATALPKINSKHLKTGLKIAVAGGVTWALYEVITGGAK